ARTIGLYGAREPQRQRDVAPHRELAGEPRVHARPRPLDHPGHHVRGRVEYRIGRPRAARGGALPPVGRPASHPSPPDRVPPITPAITSAGAWSTASGDRARRVERLAPSASKP